MRALLREPRWLLKLVSATYLHNGIRRVCSAKERAREGSSKKYFLLVCLLLKRKHPLPLKPMEGSLSRFLLQCAYTVRAGAQPENQFRVVPCGILYQTLLTPQGKPYPNEEQMGDGMEEGAEGRRRGGRGDLG